MQINFSWGGQLSMDFFSQKTLSGKYDKIKLDYKSIFVYSLYLFNNLSYNLEEKKRRSKEFLVNQYFNSMQILFRICLYFAALKNNELGNKSKIKTVVHTELHYFFHIFLFFSYLLTTY